MHDRDEQKSNTDRVVDVDCNTPSLLLLLLLSLYGDMILTWVRRYDSSNQLQPPWDRHDDDDDTVPVSHRPKQRRSFRGDGAPDPPLFGEGDVLSCFATTWFQNITSPKHDVYERSIVKACKIALWWVAVRMHIIWLPSSQFLHAIAMVQQPQHLLAFSNKCNNTQSALRYRWVTVGANIGIFSFCIIY